MGILIEIWRKIAGKTRPPVRPTAPPVKPPSPPPAPPTGNEHYAMLIHVNKERVSRSLSPLATDERLRQVAESFARELAKRNGGNMTLDHDRFTERLHAAGLDVYPCRENVAAGQTSPAQVVADWMTSPGHRETIIGPFTHFGGGVAVNGIGYWTADFADMGPRPRA